MYALNMNLRWNQTDSFWACVILHSVALDYQKVYAGKKSARRTTRDTIEQCEPNITLTEFCGLPIIYRAQGGKLLRGRRLDWLPPWYFHYQIHTKGEQ